MEQEIQNIRTRLHDLADIVQAVAVKVAVIDERQQAANDQLDRIEAAVTPLPAKVAVLEAKHADASASGAKWGAGLGAAVAALIAGLTQAFGGGGK